MSYSSQSLWQRSQSFQYSLTFWYISNVLKYNEFMTYYIYWCVAVVLALPCCSPRSDGGNVCELILIVYVTFIHASNTCDDWNDLRVIDILSFSLRMHTDTITNCTLLGSFDCDSFYKWIPLKPNRWLVAISFEVDIQYHLWNIYIFDYYLCLHNYTSIHYYHYLPVPSAYSFYFPSHFDLRWVYVESV